MMLPDVNVLVYAYRPDSPSHNAAREWLEAALAAPEPLALSELVLAGVVRILTHPRIFSPPDALGDVLRYVHVLRDHPNTRVVQPGDRHWPLFTMLCTEAGAKGNLTADAYHAALAVEHGCEFITTDRDYARFSVLRWRVPFTS